MGALKDDLDYGLKLQRQDNFKSHILLKVDDNWDNLFCVNCRIRGGVSLSFNKCSGFRYIYTGPGRIDPQTPEEAEKLSSL